MVQLFLFVCWLHQLIIQIKILQLIKITIYCRIIWETVPCNTVGLTLSKLAKEWLGCVPVHAIPGGLPNEPSEKAGVTPGCKISLISGQSY